MTGDRPLSTWQKLWLSFSRRFRDSGFWFGVALTTVVLGLLFRLPNRPTPMPQLPGADEESTASATA